MKKILVIDNDADVAETLMMILKFWKYPQPLYAHDGNEGKMVFDSEPEIFLVITDWEMPNADGEEVIRHCRASGRPVKIILMSELFPNDANLFGWPKKMNADAILPKPFLPHKILDALTISGVSPELFEKK